ncbi:hypothetical protein GCM10011487_66710 [Steroidobacter agaridevorans]|uniref:7-cyano-7-deazaguanine synthase n=1 Tax=Steroidobacter agaridevorans TaxID=2695856 RepID=A0A829YNY3_9GAMM|nr:Qat anti-phage system QueC-like protein QatC [Steroidobacter agaridevorans]GFE84671.1 hypothetical protein GCM10011487_66710 [Steroidobacter agaridevorans]
MKRHVIAGRFGPSDLSDIPRDADEQLTTLNLLSDNRTLAFGIGTALTDLRALGVTPSEMGLDLLILAAHVHAADTRIERFTQSQDSWTREIRIVVPVSDPHRWVSASATLTTLLNFLTGDLWTVGFRSRPKGFSSLARDGQPKAKHQFNELSLFSGGLDSLVGAIDLLEAGRVPLLISHAGEGAVSQSQSKLFDALKEHYGTLPFDRLRAWITFGNGLVKGVASEDSTRGRSFLFIALGAFAGTGFATRFELRVPENGFIALNVPLELLRLSSNSTRTTHPFYMSKWNELLQLLGIDGVVENPYLELTKGEMVLYCANKKLVGSLVPLSLSCASPAKGRWKGLATEHCGYCLPCLIRRAALRRAFGGNGDSTSYTVTNLASRALDSSMSEGAQVRSFQVAIERVRKRPDLADLLIHKPASLSRSKVPPDRLAQMYRRGLDEVEKLIKGVVTRPS